MTKQFAISAGVMFVMAFVLGFIVHGTILFGDYSKLPTMRPMAEANGLMHWMVLAYISFAAGFTWIYQKGREDKDWLPQGLRYGIAVATITAIPTYLIYHVVTPVPFGLAIKQIIFETISLVLMGIVLAWLNR
jgi:hypothetical protein